MEIIKNTKTEKTLEFSYQSFVDFARNRKKSETAKEYSYSSSTDSSKYRTEFTGTKDIKEAFYLAEHGWDSGISQLELQEGILVGGNGMEVQENVYGSMVNIGNYIQGLPNNMYEFTEKREFNLEPLTIYVPLTYTAGVPQKKAMKFAKSIIELVNTYQSKNNIKIIGIFYCSFGEQKLIHRITIKDFDERFVINNIAFSFHPSFFRRLLFSAIEAEEFMDSGYGSVKGQDEVHRYIKGIREGKTIMTPTLNNLTTGTFTESQTVILD